MVFSSTIFLLVFLPVVLAGNYILKGNSARNVLLLIASILFYAWGEPVYVFLMLGSITGNFFFGILLGRTRQERGRKHVLILACIFNLGILFYFKYFNFVAENLYGLFGIPYTYRSIRLPIGISFFTFQALSYVIDVYRGNAEPQRNPLNLGLYIAFFPQLIAGPIVRYNSIEHQLKNRSASMEILDQGITRFIIGFSKKVLIANNLASLIQGGALPVKLKTIQATTVGPTLGANSLNQSIIAGAIGIAAVLVFMLIFYRGLGVIADMALVVFVMLDLLMLCVTDVTLTLSGIACMILTVGMAVDANVIIFERVKEEAKQKNIPIEQAVDAGFKNAMRSIIDGNVTTLITGFVLFFMGTGAAQGFAVTLVFGVLISMFTAVVLTRHFLKLFTGSGIVKNKRFYGLA